MKKLMLTLGMASAFLLAPAATTLTAAMNTPDPCAVYCDAYAEYGKPAPLIACKLIDKGNKFLGQFDRKNPSYHRTVADANRCLDNAATALKTTSPSAYIAAAGSLQGAMGDLQAIYSQTPKTGKQSLKEQTLDVVWEAAQVLAAEQLCGSIQHWQTANPGMDWENSAGLAAAALSWAAADHFWNYDHKFVDAVAQLQAVLNQTKVICQGLSAPPDCTPPTPPTPTAPPTWVDSWDPTQGTFGVGYTGDSTGGTSYVFDSVPNTVAGTCTRLRIYLAAYDVTYPETFKLALYDSAGNCLGKSGDVAPSAVPGWVEAPLLNPITVTAQNYIIAHEATGGSIAFRTITSSSGAQGGNASATQFPVCPLPHYPPPGPVDQLDAFPLGAKICVGMYVSP